MENIETSLVNKATLSTDVTSLCFYPGSSTPHLGPAPPLWKKTQGSHGWNGFPMGRTSEIHGNVGICLALEHQNMFQYCQK